MQSLPLAQSKSKGKKCLWLLETLPSSHIKDILRSSQPQRSSLRADASWNESSLCPWNRPVPQRPSLSPARSPGAKGNGVGDTGAARTAGPWGLLWELQDLNCSWGLEVSLLLKIKKKWQAREAAGGRFPLTSHPLADPWECKDILSHRNASLPARASKGNSVFPPTLTPAFLPSPSF